MRREESWAKGKPGERDMQVEVAATAAANGQFRLSRELYRAASEMSLRAGLKQSAARDLLVSAYVDAWVGNVGPARQAVDDALGLGGVAPRGLTLAVQDLALAGDLARAQAVLDESARGIPSTDTLAQAVFLPLTRACIRRGRNAPDQALELLKTASPYERQWPMVPYARGLVLLDLRHGTEAAAEFQKVIDNRGACVVVNNARAFWPLAHLGLARAAALTGDTAKSRRAYQDFFALWNDADPDLPILIQARAEYSKLQ